VKITTTITVDIQRADGNATTITERCESHAGDNPRFEAAECAQAVDAAVVVIGRRIKNGSASNQEQP
jgi:hypothetical protein